MNIAIDRTASAVARVAFKPKKYNSRPVLEGVCIRNGEAMAADGFTLLVCPLPKENESDATVLLNAKELTAAIKTLKSGDIAAVQPTPNAYATVTPMNGKPGPQFPVSQIDGRFPDANQIFNGLKGKDVAATVTFDARLLKQLCEAYIAAHEGDQVPMTMYLRSPKEAVTFAAKIESHGRVMEGVLMPMLIGDENGNAPAKTRAES